MEMADDQIEDTDVDALLANYEADIKNKKQKEMEANFEAAEDEQL